METSTTLNPKPADTSATAYPIAIIWIPDPTTRTGWSEWCVERPEHRRPAGYKLPKGSKSK